ncbi:DNA methyltransferase [Deinococcus caeni]|uniref:DNA methylase N-4/N-6 domain-containing protein n=1 Tax=Deinococcus caeni TaxID=569127 RepID=A0ABP9UGL0_9DEIO
MAPAKKPVATPARSRKLFLGDNLKVLRDSILDESVDLVYLDPPFNSAADYNVLFRDQSDHQDSAQIMAFTDTWKWGPDDEQLLLELTQIHGELARFLSDTVTRLGRNDLSAYLVMMGVRLVELHRVLKSTGSLYLHCDPTASHYLKIIMDIVFGAKRFRSEISWRRSGAHNDAKQGRSQYGNVRDIILFYTKGDEWTWNTLYTSYSEKHLSSEYRHRDTDGRMYKQTDVTANKGGGDTSFIWRVKRNTTATTGWEADLDDEYVNPLVGWEYGEVLPYKGRYWAYSKANLAEFARAGKLHHRSSGQPRLKQYADEMPGVTLQNDWDDISAIVGTAKERLGYPTQKPVALLERIVSAR